jgi:hypothetical protein
MQKKEDLLQATWEKERGLTGFPHSHEQTTSRRICLSLCDADDLEKGLLSSEQIQEVTGSVIGEMGNWRG